MLIGSNESVWSVDVSFDNFGLKHPKLSNWPKIAVFIFQNIGICEIVDTPSNRGWLGPFRVSQILPCETFGQIWPSSGGEIGQNSRKSGFSKLVVVRATAFEQVIETWLYSHEGSWCVDVPFVCFGQIQPPELGQNLLKCPKVVNFQNMGIYEIVNPLSNRGAFPCFTHSPILATKNTL